MQSGFDYSKDILPLGNYEAVPITSLIPPYPDNFAEVLRLDIKTNVEQLRDDYHNFDKTGDYFISRMKHFKNSIKDTIKLFDDLGFSREKYKAYPLRIQGTNILLDSVGSYTRTLLQGMGVPLFRQQYVLATKGWSTKLHIDHPDFTIHGFRIFIPIDTAYIGFEENIYELLPGDCYFVNIGRKHRGFSDQDRVVIMCQMASDKLLRMATKIDPINIENVPEEYRHEP